MSWFVAYMLFTLGPAPVLMEDALLSQPYKTKAECSAAIPALGYVNPQGRKYVLVCVQL